MTEGVGWGGSTITWTSTGTAPGMMTCIGSYSYTLTGMTFTAGGGGGYTSTTSNGWVQLGYINDNQLNCYPAYGQQGPEVSDEVREAREARQARLTADREAAAVREAEAAARREAATVKAQALLLSLLPDDQKESYRLNRRFEITGSHGTRYRIRHGIAGNIDWIGDDDRVGGNLCCHAPVGWGPDWMPVEDVMIGQVLALRADEPEFLRVANGRKPVLRAA